MRCTSPKTVGFGYDGIHLAWSQKSRDKQYPTFKLPCGNCIECRLERARDTAVRCVHEASMHEQNSFITLTYADEHLSSPRLIYRDFQLFVKRLRKHIYETTLEENSRISILVTGEYGEETKRPHWHAIIFNWRPADAVYSRTTDNGDRIYNSRTLDELWGKNDPSRMPTEIGNVTLQSAGYVARYAAKKLVHGRDRLHNYEPISRRSSKNAIGKSWIERHWKQTFALGYIQLEGGVRCSIPRYYERWFKKHKPSEWQHYVTEKKSELQKQLAKKEADYQKKIKKVNDMRPAFAGAQRTREDARRIIAESRLKQLNKYLKLR